MTTELRREIDRAILEVLREVGLVTPALVAKRVKRNRRYVANRLSYLEKEGLVEKIARGLYKEKG